MTDEQTQESGLQVVDMTPQEPSQPEVQVSQRTSEESSLRKEFEAVKAELQTEKANKILDEVFAGDKEGLEMAQTIASSSKDSVVAATQLKSLKEHMVKKSVVLASASDDRLSPGKGDGEDNSEKEAVKAAYEHLRGRKKD